MFRSSTTIDALDLGRMDDFYPFHLDTQIERLPGTIFWTQNLSQWNVLKDITLANSQGDVQQSSQSSPKPPGMSYHNGYVSKSKISRKL